MKTIKHITILLILTVLNIKDPHAEAHTLEKEYNVLFIGNSLTYYNDVPSMVAAIYDASYVSQHMKVEMIAEGGYSLAQHLALPLVKQTIEDNKYDAVVIQDFGGWPYCSTEIPACSKDSDSLAELIKIIKESGAMPVWYSTYQPNPAVQKNLSKEVELISNGLEVKLADVGASLQVYMEQNKNEKVFSQDHHLNYTGSLIAAATILQIIMDNSIPKDNVVGEICIKNWRGMNLKADKLASNQPFKNKSCKTLNNLNQNKILSAVETIK